jgi:hypothetical protein
MEMNQFIPVYTNNGINIVARGREGKGGKRGEGRGRGKDGSSVKVDLTSYGPCFSWSLSPLYLSATK